MQAIPIIDAPSQTLTVQLGGQSCRIDIAQKSTGMFADLYVNDALVIGGVVCENLNRIVRSAYLGFIGDLTFADTQGYADPAYPGLGTRFLFVYLEPADLVGLI
jgi:hypothetical protein